MSLSFLLIIDVIGRKDFWPFHFMFKVVASPNNVCWGCSHWDGLNDTWDLWVWTLLLVSGFSLKLLRAMGSKTKEMSLSQPDFAWRGALSGSLIVQKKY